MFAYLCTFEYLRANTRECEESHEKGAIPASHLCSKTHSMLPGRPTRSDIDHLINRKALYMRKTRPSGAKTSTKMSVSWPVTCGELWRNVPLFSDLYDFAGRRPIYAE